MAGCSGVAFSVTLGTLVRAHGEPTAYAVVVSPVVHGRSLPLATGELQIVTARTGDHAGDIGAATMVIQHVLSADEVERHLATLAS